MFAACDALAEGLAKWDTGHLLVDGMREIVVMFSKGGFHGDYGR